MGSKGLGSRVSGLGLGFGVIGFRDEGGGVIAFWGYWLEDVADVWGKAWL